jgi:hypothetical protein
VVGMSVAWDGEEAGAIYRPGQRGELMGDGWPVAASGAFSCRFQRQKWGREGDWIGTVLSWGGGGMARLLFGAQEVSRVGIV